MTDVTIVKHQLVQEQWKQIIDTCQSSGISAAQWCRDNNVNYKAYLYRLRKYREETCEQLIVPLGNVNTSAATIKVSFNGMEISIPDGANPETIETVMRIAACYNR